MEKECPKSVRETLTQLANSSSRSDPDIQRFISAEARLYIFKATESIAERRGYTEFYKNEVERAEISARDQV